MISIIVPIYGVEHYIERCARSVLEQTYDDIEYIFVNDCTKDSSMHILNEVIKEYPHRNIHIINKDKNEGLPQARKTGFLASHGDYIIHFDSDDWVDLECIYEMYKVAKKDDSDVVVADYYENYQDKEIVIRCSHFDSPSDGIDKMLRAEVHSGVWNKLVKRNLYENVTFPTSNMHEDLATMIQVFAKAKKISFINQPFYHYNQMNAACMTNDSHSFSRMKNAYDNLRLIEDFLKSEGLLENHACAFSNFVNSFKVGILMHPDTRKKEWINTLYPQSKQFLFSENRQSFIKTIFLWFAMNNCYWPCKFVDVLRKIFMK